MLILMHKCNKLNDKNNENNPTAKVDLIAFETLCDYNAASVRAAYQLNQN